MTFSSLYINLHLHRFGKTIYFSCSYEGGRIKQMETGNPNDCAMQITDIKDIDNGEWECSVTGKGPNGDFQIGQGKVQVIVAVPPTAVALQMDGQPITGKKSIFDEDKPKILSKLNR